jgi:PAS domain S-box-containing protein
MLVVGLLVAALGASARLEFLGESTPKVAYLTAYPAVIVAAFFGGPWGGASAIVGSAVLVHFFFVPLKEATDWLGLAIFTASCVLVIALTERLSRTREHVAAEQAAREVDARLAAIVESSSDAIISITLDRKITSWNAAASRVFGYAAEEMIGREITCIVPPHLLDEEATILSRLRAGQGVEHYETVRLARDGRRIDVSLTISPLVDAAGHVTGASEILHDITARKKVEQVLRDSEQQKGFLLELGDALKPLSDPDEIKDAASGVLGRQIGANQVLYAEIDPTDVFALVSRDWNDGSMASNVGAHKLVDFGLEFVADLKARKTVVIDDVAADPRTSSPWVQAMFQARNIKALICVPQVKIGHLVSVLSVHCHSVRHWRDFDAFLVEEVAERTRAAVESARAGQALRESEAARRESEKNFRLLADAMPQLAWIARADGYIYWYNQRWYQYTGAAPGQTEGWGWRGFHDPDVLPLVMDRWMASITTGKPFDMTFPLRGADGKFRPFLTRMMPVLDSDGKVLQWFGTNTDVSEQKALEEDLRHAKRGAERANLAKVKFLAAASHDLRQPVQSLTLLLSVIKRQLPETAAATEAISLAENSVTSLNAMLAGILDLSRLDAGVVAPQVESVDLGEFVGRLAREYQSRAAASGLVLRVAPRALRARTDAALLERILRNLIENALRYTAEGGALIGLRQRGDRVRIDVIDTGIGIPADQQAEIFEEFWQLHNPARDSSKGLGLGLAIVSRLARLLGAELEISSRPSRGARFSVLLPLDRSAPVAPPARIAVDDPGGRILVIEDNPTVRAAYVSMLSLWGYEVLGAASGEEAIDRAAQENWRVEAIIADYRLGPGLTGASAIAEIVRQAGRSVPAMLVTGDTAQERLAEASGGGFVLLHKPVNAAELREKLASLLREA